MNGKLYLVSVGPGFSKLIPPLAEAALRGSDAIVGYDLYLRWIADWISGKEIHSLPLTREKERAARAIELAREGRSVSLVSSGDIGVYGMAGLALEMMEDSDAFDVAIIPGISAANSCASLLGSPLSHDFATLSLSDLLCPWEWIEQRARHLAQADFVVALYNVQSRGRHSGIYRVLRIFSEEKPPGIWCGVVRNAYREGEQVSICTLGELFEREFDMLTTIIVGNRFTQRRKKFLYTPRGYHAWPEPTSCGNPSMPRGAVWVFSGTSDGNQLARALAESGHCVVISAASEYGRETAHATVPGIAARAGRTGPGARKRELINSAAMAIVDATHPFAVAISQHLVAVAQEIGIPYLRYERPAMHPAEGAHYCRSAEDAAVSATGLGRRIFLAVGIKELATFLRHGGQREWFIRVAPDARSIERVLDLGLPRSRICAMQGPFSRAFNVALWSDWEIDCVVTKDSGEAGGFVAKVEAASALSIPLVVVERPAMSYPFLAHDFDGILHELENLKAPAPLHPPPGPRP